MKKARVILLVLALLQVPSNASRAAAPETGGEMRVRGWKLDNYLKDDKNTEYCDQRLRLSMTWPLAEGVRIQARADILEGLWGGGDQTAAQAGTAVPAAGAPNPAVTPPGAGTRQPIAFDWVSLQFVAPGTPVLFSLGRQDVSWGTGFWVQADNRDRFQVAAKLDPVVLVFAYDKFTEAFMSNDRRDDQRGWAVGAVAEGAGCRFGLLAAYLKDESRTRFPAGDLSYAAGDFFAKGRLGPVQFQAELTYGSGTIHRGALGDLDAEGLGAYVGLFLPVGPSATFGLEGAYARGDDPATAGKNEGFFSADYQGPYWSVIFYNNMDRSGYAGDGQTSSSDLDFSVRNAITAKLSVACTPSKKLTVTGSVLRAAADQVRSGVDASMGWEFDLVAVYGITENVSLTAGFGYALLGDYWKSAPVCGGGKPDNPRGGLIAFTTRF